MKNEKYQRSAHISLLGQILKYIIIEHNLIQKMPIPNKLLPQYLQHSYLISPIIDRIISPQIFTRANPSLTNMFQYLNLIQYLIITFIIILWCLFFLFKIKFCCSKFM